MVKMKPAKAWVVAVGMGYGHLRAAYALRDLAYGGIVLANSYPGIPAADRQNWRLVRRAYETISRLKSSLPVVGEWLFDAMDRFQQIEPFYPRRDLSAPNAQLNQTYGSLRRGLGRHLIERLIAHTPDGRRRPLPLIATFFTAAYAAEEFGYPGDIYLCVCDADVSRAWAPLRPHRSRIRYFAPNGRVAERLKLYGVRAENISLTGFPLPKENIGGPRATDVKPDLAARLRNLDPQGIFTGKYRRTLAAHLGRSWSRLGHRHPLTLTFAVGGAGAQRGIGLQAAASLADRLRKRQIELHLVAGTSASINRYYLDGLRDIGLGRLIGRQIFVHHQPRWEAYFAEFGRLLHRTDILWTKPSELSFYTGLGLPIVMAPPLGSQEEFNRVWLKTVGGGVSQNDPRYANEWLFDWLDSGGLARMAWNGFIEAPTHGTYRIESAITGRPVELEQIPLIV